LALLRPFFLDGWLSPPSGVDNPGLVANQAALALSAVGLRREEGAQQVFSIRDCIGKGLSHSLSVRVRNHYFTVRDRNELARAARILQLSRDVAAALELDQDTLSCDVFQVMDSTFQGDLEPARRLWTDMTSRPAWRQRAGQLEAQGLVAEALLLYREGSLTVRWLDEARDRVRELGQRSSERSLQRLIGRWHQSLGDHPAAIDAFAGAIVMARAVGLDDTDSEARRGLSLARLGRRNEAQAAAASAMRAPHHDVLAELHFVLGDSDQARQHALAGYRWYWADGPPWCWHWALETCRDVLQVLGEPEPQMPAFDPARVRPIEYEADVRRLLADHAAKPMQP
jgi:hypothetical protein